MKILVDADACPVKEIILNIKRKYNIEVMFVCSLSHYTNFYELNNIKPVYVDDVFQSADMAIINKAVKGDIIVTGDYGLAAMVLSKGAYAISFDGRVFDNENIDGLLNKRHQNMKLLRSGSRVKGPSKRSKEDDYRFMASLEKMLISNKKF
ncbi:YaiI/YqxD family protein [Lutispora thermophila]|uniref:UPF0178 protein SAMN02745176_01711 n=1 Tax=Lutispora thermophila DSM 19022 TaxID=1122184 RepID=A0A1M6EV72_9FIRM|nr:YaiI/YqxD family protein [Lutispora thermophila]SHI89250.1 hypothetical protein SAMN02745176_01711 [Lutispora thermophila DSM 19022]